MGDDDPVARLRAQMDQFMEGAKEFASTIAAFYTQLVVDGVSANHASAITCTYLAELLRMPRSESSE